MATPGKIKFAAQTHPHCMTLARLEVTALATLKAASLLEQQKNAQVLNHIMSVESPIRKRTPPLPLRASGEGRQSAALAGRGSSHDMSPTFSKYVK